jgi:hypothetical protein
MMRRSWSAALIVMVSVITFASNRGWAQETEPFITLQEAHNLSVLTLTPRARRFPGMRFDSEKEPHPPEFYWFEVTANVPDNASPLLGYFAVNRVTGDVWNPVECKRLESPALARLQKQLRKKINIPEIDFRHASESVPCRP